MKRTKDDHLLTGGEQERRLNGEKNGEHKAPPFWTFWTLPAYAHKIDEIDEWVSTGQMPENTRCSELRNVEKC